MKLSRILIIAIPVLVFVAFVIGMMKWLNVTKPSPANKTFLEDITPTPTVYLIPTQTARKTTSLLEQVSSFDPFETKFTPPVFEKVPELPKD
jgi:hypothetical protein